ncbi:MAG: protein TolA [Xanthobacteraceae bacterium]
MTISCVGHVGALILGLVAISAHPLNAPPVESLPVSFISEKDFTQLTQGVKNAPQLKIPDLKPFADKVDLPKAVDQLAPKAADKPAVTTDASKPKAEPKPEPKPDPKPADKPDKPKAPDYKPDQIADLLKKDAAKTPPKPDESTPQKTAQNSPKFDANQVAELLDKREPQRQLAAADALNNNVTLGAATGAAAAQLSQSEIDALRARISQCWSPPPGIDANTRIHVSLRVLLRVDGSLAQEPALVEASASALGPALAESAERALMLCQPFTMLKREHYDQWKDLQLDFDPHQLLGG